MRNFILIIVSRKRSTQETFATKKKKDHKTQNLKILELEFELFDSGVNQKIVCRFSCSMDFKQ